MTIATRDIKRSDESPTQVMAGERLNLRNKGARDKLSTILLWDRVHGERAWNHFDQIGEVHFALTRAARIAGYSRFFPVKVSPDGSKVETQIESGAAAEAIASIYSRVGGMRGLVERYFIHMKVPAESHLIRVKMPNSSDYDGYQFVSSKELDDGSGKTGITIENNPTGLTWTTLPKISTPTAQGNPFTRSVAQRDYIGRVWMPSAQWLDAPDSTLNALDTECDLLHTMTEQMRAAFHSRFAVAGMLYFSSEVKEALGGNDIKSGNGKSTLDVIYEIMKTNMDQADQIYRFLPILLMGKADPEKFAKHLTIDRQIFETDLKLRAELIDRILFGLDINAQAAKGNTEVNHWGAWASNADEVRLAVIPDVEALCWVFDRFILHPALLAAKMRPEQITRIRTGYDLTEASVRADRNEASRQLRDRGILKALPALKAAGYTEADLLDGLEYIRWFGAKHNDPYLATFGLPEAEGIDWTKTVAGIKVGRPAGDSPEEPDRGPGDGDPGAPEDRDNEAPTPGDAR